MVRKGYEIVAASAKGTPLFLSRPKSTGSTNDEYKKLEGSLGVPQNDWNNPEVEAVNKFHNIMIGKSQYIRKPNTETIVIERGTDGIVIINLDGGFDGYVDTNMKSGQYKDYVSGKDFNVSNGKIHIKVESGRTAVIMNEQVHTYEAYIQLPEGWAEPYAYVYEDDGKGGASRKNAAWPGIKMDKVRDRLYKYEVDKDFYNPLVIFNDKKKQYPLQWQKGLYLDRPMIYMNGLWTSYIE